MTNQTGLRLSPFVLCACVLALLVFWFARFIPTASFDLVQHYLLVDELMKHAAVRPDAFQRIGAMAFYPPAAHWMAAIIGWIGGSGLVGISIVTIASMFLCYLLICRLLGSAASTIMFLIIFLLLRFTHSQVGWEVIGNFFYPQLVADVAYFAVLLWLSRTPVAWVQTVTILIGTVLTMWIQPLIAVHILAAGCSFMFFQIVRGWRTPERNAVGACLAVLVIVGAAAVLLHPAFAVMLRISGNDGYLVFSYEHVLLVALACAGVGAFNLIRRSDRIDTVVGSAVIAAVALALLQFSVLKLHGDGSAYAVKKHMFLVFTLGLMNAVRAVMGSRWAQVKFRSDLVAPLAAGVMSFLALKGFETPVAPILSAMNYANQVASFGLPDFTPGNTVADDSALPLMGNVMISLTAFQHPFDDRAISWQRGTPVKEGAKYVMTGRTAYLDTICPEKVAQGQKFVVIEPVCLSHYAPGETLSFAVGGNGWQYATNGWGNAEPWGTWSLGDKGGLISLIGVPNHEFELIVDGRAYLTAQHPAQTVVVEVNGRDLVTWLFDSANPDGQRVAKIPEELSRDGSLHIVLKTPGAVSPAQIGQSSDARVLGIGLKTLTLRAEHE